MNIRKIIREELECIVNQDINYSSIIIDENAISDKSNLLSESQKPLPKQFDHLKWKLNNNQKYYLDELCSVEPSSITESDIKSASKFLGIPEKSVKSILNTYNAYDSLREGGHTDSVDSINSRLTFGNKAVNAFDIGIDNNANVKPIRFINQIVNNPPTMSKSRMEYEAYKQKKDRKLYRAEKGEEHPSKSIERFYESLNKSLMMYLFVEANPKDINLRFDNKIQIDFESIIEEGEKFNKLDGGPNYENDFHKFIKGLLEDFNKKFGCKYIIYEHIKTDNGVRIFIENNVTKQIDMSQDSLGMMKKFLLPKIITGHKIQTNDPSVASLIGLDAGDTSWLYGSIDSPMQSGVLSRVHQGRA